MGALSDLVCTARALAFIAEEEDLGHSLAVCPTPPQNRQRLLLNRHVRSACVSFPSLPSLSERSGFFFSEFLNEPPWFEDWFFLALFFESFFELLEEDCWFDDLSGFFSEGCEFRSCRVSSSHS